MKNRLNDLDSKSYMKFLKSWYINDDSSLLDFIRFFTKEYNPDETSSAVAVYGVDYESIDLQRLTGRRITDITKNALNEKISYAIINLQNETLESEQGVNIFFVNTLTPILKQMFQYLEDRRYITIFVRNHQSGSNFYPAAWHMGKLVTAYFEMKDEKLGCINGSDSGDKNFPVTGSEVLYALNFRQTLTVPKTSTAIKYHPGRNFTKSVIPSWFILKPPPRHEKVKLHPAKFPEVLISRYIEKYTKPGESVFDPMSGTGSTQMASLESGRLAYGCEITDHFYRIAVDRLRQFSKNNSISSTDGNHLFFIEHGDAYYFDRNAEFPPEFDYIITSPPYWDMLNMKGAETQQKRRDRDLLTNYSDLDTDLGNCAEYDIFLAKLIRIYDKVISRLKPGGHMTIIVKNIKKKGTIYTFAWDLAEKLAPKMELCDLSFWLQDDIRIAPYGYGNAWVSNTFHQYCLTFQKTG
ncbi:MAG: DNA methyltransferase [Calditrichaceae bacterium]